MHAQKNRITKSYYNPQNWCVFTHEYNECLFIGSYADCLAFVGL